MQQEFIRGLSRLEPRHRGCVATIGSFDGVHRGHQVILQQVIERGRELGVPSLAMVFEPQPHEYFLRAKALSREKAPPRLMRLREKVKALFEAGVDRVLCLQFDSNLRSLSARDFIERVLVQGLGIRHLTVGDDFRFGCDRRGDYRLLCEAGAREGFSVSDTPTCEYEGERISSTRIRRLLEQDEFERAAALLGRPFGVAGRVIHGRRLGRQLAAPTANVGLGRYRSPVQGVYAVEVKHGGQLLPGAANVGVRPTLGGGEKPLLEVHIFDFVEEIYGQCIEVIFRKKLRDEEKFDSLEVLQAQIQRDFAEGRQFFNLPPRSK